MSWHDVWNVLKWVLAALVAGFIGQFGKSLALHILKRRKRKQEEKAGSQASTSGLAPSQNGADQAHADAQARSDDAYASAQAKIEKKRAKAEVKRLKKQDKS